MMSVANSWCRIMVKEVLVPNEAAPSVARPSGDDIKKAFPALGQAGKVRGRLKGR
jgi:hypothetical protein